MSVLGITGIFGGLSVLLLPETANQGLADTLEAIEEDTRYVASTANHVELLHSRR